MQHIINLYNKDNIQNLKKIGSSAVSFKNGIAYICDEHGNDIPISGLSNIQLIEFFKNNKILDNMESDLSKIGLSKQFYLNSDTIPDSLPTVSVHHILVEHNYVDDPITGVPYLNSMSFRRISAKTKATDVEVLDLRLDDSLEVLGHTDAETLINYILFAELDLDESFDPSSNKAILLDSSNVKTSKLKLKLKTTDVLEEDTDAKSLMTAKAGLSLKKYIKETLAGMIMYTGVKLTNIDNTGKETVYTAVADPEDHTIKIKTDTRKGITASIDSMDKSLNIEHTKIGSSTTLITPRKGVIEVINGVVTDDMGHVTSIKTRNIYNDIKAMYSTRSESDAIYVKKTNTSTEVIDASVEIKKNLTVRNNMIIKGNLYTQGDVTAIETKDVVIKDNIIDIGDSNDTIHRYTGIRFRVANDSKDNSSGYSDIFMAYDNVDKAVSFFTGGVDVTDDNAVNVSEYINIKAATFDGISTSAIKLKNPTTLRFIGAVEGSVQFYGDEGTIDVPLSVKKASNTSYGTVMLLDDLNTVPNESTAYVYSAKFLYNKLTSLNSIEISNSYIPTTIPETASAEEREKLAGIKTLATQHAIHAAYEHLMAFQKKYDAAAIAAAAAALERATTIVSVEPRITFTIARNMDIAATVTGKGYDEVLWNSENIKTDENYHEFWKASFALAIDSIEPNSKIFTVMSKRSKIIGIRVPKLNIAKTPYSLSHDFKFELRMYDTAGSTNYTVAANLGSNTYNINKHSIGYSMLYGETDTRVSKFINLLDFSEWSSSWKAPYVSSVIKNKVVISEPHTFSSIPSPYTRNDVSINNFAVTMGRASTMYRATLFGISHTKPYVHMFRFKITNNTGMSAADSINISIKEYTLGGDVIDKVIATVPYSTLVQLTTDTWYTLVTYIKDSTGTTLSGLSPGIYTNGKIITAVSTFANIPSLTANQENITSDNNITSREYVLSKTSSLNLIIMTPVFTPASEVSSSAQLTALAQKDYDTIFYTNATDTADVTTISGLNKDKYYELVAVSVATGTPMSLVGLDLPTGTTFGTRYNIDKDIIELLPPPGTSNGAEIVDTLLVNNVANIAAVATRASAVQDTKVVHNFLKPVISETDLHRTYYVPKNNRLIKMNNDRTSGSLEQGTIAKFFEDVGVWKHWTVVSSISGASIKVRTYTELNHNASTIDELKAWSFHKSGDVVTIKNHVNFSAPAIMYYSGTGWNAHAVPDLNKLDTIPTESATYDAMINASITPDIGTLHYIPTGEQAGLYLCKAGDGTLTRSYERISAWFGWNKKGQTDSYIEFTEKYTVTLSANTTHALVGTQGNYTRYMFTSVYHNGSNQVAWEFLGEEPSGGYIYGNDINRAISLIDKSDTPTKGALPQITPGTDYIIPNNNDYVVISTSYTVVGTDPVDYTYHANAIYKKATITTYNGITTLTWKNLGLFSAYRKPVANYTYTGNLNAVSGAVTIPITLSYAYINAH